MTDIFYHILKVFSMLVQFYLSPSVGSVTHQRYFQETYWCYCHHCLFLYKLKILILHVTHIAHYGHNYGC